MPAASSSMARRCSTGERRSSQPRTAVRRASCSSLKVKSTQSPGPKLTLVSCYVARRWTSPWRRRTRRSATSCAAWLDEHLPKFLAEWGDRDDPEAAPDGDTGQHGIMGAMERRRAWQRTLNEGRWAAINWPVEWGGREATVTQNVIYSEEMARARTPGIYNANGLWQIGPMIIRWGTDEQKERWIPNILDADDHWCQGFSEPEAGSDLANLRTLAVARRRRLRAQRPEDLDLLGPHRPAGACSSSAPTRRPSSGAPSTRASPR